MPDSNSKAAERLTSLRAASQYTALSAARAIANDDNRCRWVAQRRVEGSDDSDWYVLASKPSMQDWRQITCVRPLLVFEFPVATQYNRVGTPITSRVKLNRQNTRRLDYFMRIHADLHGCVITLDCVEESLVLDVANGELCVYVQEANSAVVDGDPRIRLALKDLAALMASEPSSLLEDYDDEADLSC